jgi:uncharacterized membrane protein YGL010W
MSRIQSLLDEYSENHRNETNKLVHWICVPAIVISLLGLLWSIPVPYVFHTIRIGPVYLNWAIIFMMLALIYYTRLSLPLAAGMFFVGALFLYINYLLSRTGVLPLWAFSLIIFSLAWIGQFWGHKVEGKKPSFLKDLQFLLIGPVWLLHFIYRKAGIVY